MGNFTKPITVNGNVNVYTAAVAAGYTGQVSNVDLMVENNSATACYIHFTSNGLTAPGTAADGFLISTSAPSYVFSMQNIDLGTTWLVTGSSISVKVMITGG